MTFSMKPTDRGRVIADQLVADRAALDGGTAEEARTTLIAEGCLPRGFAARRIAERVYNGEYTVLLGYGRVFRLLEGCPEEARPRALSGALNLFTQVMEEKASVIDLKTSHARDVRECLRQAIYALDRLVSPWDGACDPGLVVEAEHMKDRASAFLDGAGDGLMLAAPIAWWALDVYGMQGMDDSLCRLCCAVAAASGETERALALRRSGHVVEDTPRMRADLNAFLIEHGGELSRGAGPAVGSPSAAGWPESRPRRTRAAWGAPRWEPPRTDKTMGPGRSGPQDRKDMEMPDNNFPADTDYLAVHKGCWTSGRAGRASDLFEEIDRDISEVVFLATSSGDRELARDLVELLWITMGIQKSLWDTTLLALEELKYD